jgi:hypothetical protein
LTAPWVWFWGRAMASRLAVMCSRMGW